MKTLKLKQPDDFHLHLRSGAAMRSVVADTARQFSRAVIMPNLQPPIVTVTQALAYRQEILASLPADCRFQPLMTLYLSETLSPREIIKARQSDHVYAVKYYPQGATTYSAAGVKHIETVYPLLEIIAKQDLPLLVHGEVADPEIDIFDREAVFIERVLQPLSQRWPELRIVFEHISTREAVEFIKTAPPTLAATITPHHLLLNRNALLADELRPHHYCSPILKAEQHRLALIKAIASGNPKFFLGTDSAPHAKATKESACGCAGIYSAHSALALYAEVFENAECLDLLEGFASHHGADFYQLPRNNNTITLQKTPWRLPETLRYADTQLIPFRAGAICQWKLR